MDLAFLHCTCKASDSYGLVKFLGLIPSVTLSYLIAQVRVNICVKFYLAFNFMFVFFFFKKKKSFESNAHRIYSKQHRR